MVFLNFKVPCYGVYPLARTVKRCDGIIDVNYFRVPRSLNQKAKSEIEIMDENEDH